MPVRFQIETLFSTIIKMIKIVGYRVMLGAMPQVKERIVQMMEDIGFDPFNDSEDTVTPIGIGNKVGNHIVEWSYSDGVNQVSIIVFLKKKMIFQEHYLILSWAMQTAKNTTEKRLPIQSNMPL